MLSDIVPPADHLSVRLQRGVILLLVLVAISASAFIAVVNRPVFDDGGNMQDASRYATLGLSSQTVHDQVNPTGPASFIWMSAAMRLIGGDPLRDARIAVLSSWLLFGGGLLFGARLSKTPDLWYCALLATLTFPLAETASATVLTEGPALLFAVLGSLLWVESMASQQFTSRKAITAMAAGLLIGIGITARQYYLALLPAMILFLIYCLRIHKGRNPLRRIAATAASLVLAALPVAALVSIWGGLSSPAISESSPFAEFHSSLGVNAFRPGVALFYTAAYLLPLTFPMIRTLTSLQGLAALAAGVVGAAVALPQQDDILQPGSVRAIIELASSRSNTAGALCFALLTALITVNFAAFLFVLWRRRSVLYNTPPAFFAALVVVLFLCEQIGVDGNIPFYDRYILQIMPFLGLLTFALDRKLTTARIAVFTCLFALSQAMLWRHAFRS